MHDKTHIRLVYSHTEGVGADHHPYLVLTPGLLTLASHRVAQAGVVIGGGNAVCRKHGRHFLCLGTVADINDARTFDSITN